MLACSNHSYGISIHISSLIFWRYYIKISCLANAVILKADTPSIRRFVFDYLKKSECMEYVQNRYFDDDVCATMWTKSLLIREIGFSYGIETFRIKI
jgi:hypothetical protein